MGYSPIAFEKNAVGLGLGDGGVRLEVLLQRRDALSGVLKHPNHVKEPANACGRAGTPPTAVPPTRAKVAVLEEGHGLSRPFRVPNSDAQYLETRKFQLNEICRIFRVPPHMVGDLEHATFSNIEHQSISIRGSHHPPVAGSH